MTFCFNIESYCKHFEGVLKGIKPFNTAHRTMHTAQQERIWTAMTKFIDVRGNDNYATAAAWTTVNTGHHQFVRLILISQQYKNMKKKEYMKSIIMVY